MGSSIGVSRLGDRDGEAYLAPQIQEDTRSSIRSSARRGATQGFAPPGHVGPLHGEWSTTVTSGFAPVRDRWNFSHVKLSCSPGDVALGPSSQWLSGSARWVR